MAGNYMWPGTIWPSLTLQMIRFFVPSGIRNFTYWSSHCLIWLNVLFYITCTLLLIFACKPEAKIYDPTIQGGHCLDSAAILISTAVINTVSDMLMLFLPQKIIWDLRMPLRKKLGLSAAFLVALLTFASSIVRLYFATQLRRSPDISYNIGWLGMWTLPEITIGFLISCMPFIPKFTAHVIRKPSIARAVHRLYSMLKMFSPRRQRHGRSGYQETPHIPKQGRPSRIISDVEFDELVLRTAGSSTTVQPDPESQCSPYWAQNDPQRRQSEWPANSDAHLVVVWTAKDEITKTSMTSDTDGIIVTTNVSVSRA